LKIKWKALTRPVSFRVVSTIQNSQGELVSQKEALQSAADEARKAARAAREFAGILDEYAKLITQPNVRQRADDIHLSAMNKLKVINDGLVVCQKWGDEGRKAAMAPVAPAAPVAEPSMPASNHEARGNREQVAKIQPRSVRVHKRSNNR
jgi:hypothetical protein